MAKFIRLGLLEALRSECKKPLGCIRPRPISAWTHHCANWLTPTCTTFLPGVGFVSGCGTATTTCPLGVVYFIERRTRTRGAGRSRRKFSGTALHPAQRGYWSSGNKFRNRGEGERAKRAKPKRLFKTLDIWRARRDSNSRPSDSKSGTSRTHEAARGSRTLAKPYKHD